MIEAEHLLIAREDHPGGPLPQIEGCKLELISRDELVARHGGRKTAPLITAITTYRTGIREGRAATGLKSARREQALTSAFDSGGHDANLYRSAAERCEASVKS